MISSVSVGFGEEIREWGCGWGLVKAELFIRDWVVINGRLGHVKHYEIMQTNLFYSFSWNIPPITSSISTFLLGMEKIFDIERFHLNNEISIYQVFALLFSWTGVSKVAFEKVSQKKVKYYIWFRLKYNISFPRITSHLFHAILSHHNLKFGNNYWTSYSLDQMVLVCGIDSLFWTIWSFACN